MKARTLVVERKNWLMASVAAVMVFAMLLSAQAALAAGHDTFKVSIYHGINGRSLGLSKELPVNISSSLPESPATRHRSSGIPHLVTK